MMLLRIKVYLCLRFLLVDCRAVPTVYNFLLFSPLFHQSIDGHYCITRLNIHKAVANQWCCWGLKYMYMFVTVTLHDWWMRCQIVLCDWRIIVFCIWNPSENNIYTWIVMNNGNIIPQHKSVTWLLLVQTTAK
jgi:hypothetical protein